MLTVIAKDLIDAISILGMVPPRGGIVASEFIRVRCRKSRLHFALAAEAYGEVFVKGDGALPVPDDWCFYIDRTLFEPFVSSTTNPKSLFKFKFRRTYLVVYCGRRRAKFRPTDPMGGHAEVSKKIGVPITLSEKQLHYLQLAVQYATHDPTLANYNCVFMKKRVGVIAATVTAIFHAKDTSVPVTVPLPLMLTSIISNTSQSLDAIKNIIRLQFKCGAICQLLNVKSAKEFPAKTLLQQITSAAAFPHQFTINATSLLQAVERQQAVISGSVKRDLVAKIFGDKGAKRLYLSCDAPQGTFKETLSLLAPLKRDVSCEILMSQLLPLATHAKSLIKLKFRYVPLPKTSEENHFHIAGKGIELMVSRKALL